MEKVRDIAPTRRMDFTVLSAYLSSLFERNASADSVNY